MKIQTWSNWNRVDCNSKQYIKENYNGNQNSCGRKWFWTQSCLKKYVKLSLRENWKYLSQTLSYEVIMVLHLWSILWIQKFQRKSCSLVERKELSPLWVNSKQFSKNECTKKLPKYLLYALGIKNRDCQVLKSVSKTFLALQHTWSLTNATSSFSRGKIKKLSHKDFG